MLRAVDRRMAQKLVARIAAALEKGK